MKKLTVIILLISIISFGVSLPKKADAIFGVADISINPEGVVGWLWNAGTYVKDVAIDIALTRLKKRLLDRITDDTIKWIQGEGSPRFVTDPAGLIKDAGDAAIGDTIQAIGAGDLCYPSGRSRLIMQVETPVFSERISCTLTGVLGNLNTSISDFRNDFRSGGWLAWQETMKLQNNRWGVEALTQNELQKKTNERTTITAQEVASGNSFLDQKRCLEWTKVQGEEQGVFLSGEDYYLRAPGNDDQDIKEGVIYVGLTDQPVGSEWKCTDTETITPGSVIGNQLADTVSSEIGFINNANSLGQFASAIIDAAITRLTKDATAGLLGLFSGEGSPPREESSNNCQGLEGELLASCEDFQKKQNDAVKSSSQAVNDVAGSLAGAITYGDCENLALNLVTNGELYDDLGEVKSTTLRACFAITLASGPFVHVSSDNIINTGELHEHTDAVAVSIATPKRQLLDYRWEWKSCPGGVGQCPEINPETVSGSLLSGSATIPGPKYTPEQQGIYELELIVRDTGGKTNLANNETYLSSHGGGSLVFYKLSDVNFFAENGKSIENFYRLWEALFINNFIKAKNTLKESTVTINAGGPHDMPVSEPFTHTGAFIGPTPGVTTYAWELTSCPGQCPSITNGSTGTFSQAGVGGSINGPTFTPNDLGQYTLKLTVFGSSGGNIQATVTNTTFDEVESNGSGQGEDDNNGFSIGSSITMTASIAHESFTSWPIDHQTDVILINPGSKGIIVGGPESAPVQGSDAVFWQVDWDDYQTTWIEDSVIEILN
ncbi:MAG: hypothetical protein WD095_01095 [Candidatus Paceibacterota bacterium]